MNLIPELRMYFAFGKIIGISEPDQVKRPYLSLIKMITRSKYRLFKSDYRIPNNSEKNIIKRHGLLECKT